MQPTALNLYVVCVADIACDPTRTADVAAVIMQEGMSTMLLHTTDAWIVCGVQGWPTCVW